MIITGRDCEIVKQLISLYCESDPGDIDISVSECLDLFAKMVVAVDELRPVGACAQPEELAERERERDAGAARLRFVCR